MTKHTPGPWSCDYGDFAVYCDTGAEVCAVTQGNHDDGTRIPADEMEANLQLVAAAPELLAVCQSLLGCLSDWCEIADDDDQREDDHLAMAAANAAIAKAEGKAQCHG